MANTYKLISAVTVGAGGASSIVFSSIPQTYTDLLVRLSTRSASGGADAYTTRMKVNNLTTSIYSQRTLEGAGNSGTTGFSQSGVDTAVRAALINGTAATTNTFAVTDIYIPNYTSANNKSAHVETVSESNNTTMYINATAFLVATSAAITDLTFTNETSAGNFAQYSTAYLYGIANPAPNPTPLATGGDLITTDGTYWYHTFLNSGTFTPLQTLSAVDVLVVAGGGGGSGGNNSDGSSGGGAGGYRTTTYTNLTASGRAVTVGNGGAGGASNVRGSNGNNSSFAGTTTLTSTYGGGGGSYNPGDNGAAGGSGGGGAGGGSGGGCAFQSGGGAGNLGGFSPVEGYAGGAGYNTCYYGVKGGGGGGGATAAGQAGTGIAGAGGAGVDISTFLGQSAGTTRVAGGGGGAAGNNTAGSGGVGGGGTGNGTAGTANTGGGGGGRFSAGTGGAGGKGVVYVRYAV